MFYPQSRLLIPLSNDKLSSNGKFYEKQKNKNEIKKKSLEFAKKNHRNFIDNRFSRSNSIQILLNSCCEIDFYQINRFYQINHNSIKLPWNSISCYSIKKYSIKLQTWIEIPAISHGIKRNSIKLQGNSISCYKSLFYEIRDINHNSIKLP